MVNMELNEMRLLEKVTLFGLCLFFFFLTVIYLFCFLGGSASKESARKGGDPGSILGSGRQPTPVFWPGIPWTQKPGGPYLMGLQRVGHD